MHTRAVLAALVVCLIAGLGIGPAMAATSELPVPYGLIGASSNVMKGIGTPPPGANDWSCLPSAAHPYPVVLINGTFANMTENWTTISPLLKNNGYCVYGFDYGQNSVTTATGGWVTAIGPITTSADQLSAFVDRVLQATHASKVDLVGHSQGGGLLPRYYINFLGGNTKVARLVGIAPSQHGTTLDGLGLLASYFPTPPGFSPESTACQACIDQTVGSAFLTKLATKPDTAPGIDYTTISTRYDEVVTPYTTQALSGPNVTNILTQDGCPFDFSDHVSIVFTRRTGQMVLNALDPAHAIAPPCGLVLPVLG